MQIEMTIKGLMVDPITNMPIVILRDKDGQQGAADLGRRLRGERDRAADRERHAAAADDARPAQQRDPRSQGRHPEDRRLGPEGEHVLRADLSVDRREKSWSIDARPSDAIALALRARAPIFVEDRVIDNAKTVDLAPEKGDSERLQKWLENLDPDTMGKYKM